jgi:hypothetical protein
MGANEMDACMHALHKVQNKEAQQAGNASQNSMHNEQGAADRHNSISNLL